MMRTIQLFVALAIFWAATPGRSDDKKVILAAEGEALLPIQIPGNASQELSIQAATLADYLERMSGADFQITMGKEERAIQLIVEDGTPSATERENYSIRSNADGLTLSGTTELALQHAVWDLLFRLGYRQYFPGENWEIIPKLDTIEIAINATESPDYNSRRIWYGFGFWDHNKSAWEDWVRKNRMEGGFELNTGHAYSRLIRSQQEAFDAHPEYYALVDNQRKIQGHAKLCISNPGVLDAAVAYAFDFFEENPDADSVSVDPSDGGNWCECQDCATLGPPNDRALILANAVAKAVTDKLGPDRFVGMYAYGYHSLPPSIQVHPNVIISAATGFIKGGLKIEDVVAGWSGKGATIGIREYYSVHTWDRDLPGASRGSNLEYLSETIPRFHQMGARFLSAESSDNWGCNGLGYFFASRALWDLNEVDRRDAIVADFLENCFGPASEPMGKFFSLIEGSNKSARFVFDDVLARMFRHLSEARKLAGSDESIQRRINDLILYARYAEMFDHYRNGKGEERQAAYEALIRHAYRMRDSFMIHTYALWRDLANRDKTVSYPENAHWKIPETKNPWKSSELFNRGEIDQMLDDGIANHELVELDFEPREFSDENLVPAKSIFDLPDVPAVNAERGRGLRSWFTVVDEAPAEIELIITGGLIEHYRDRGNVKVELWKLGGASQTGERETLMDENSSAPPDGMPHTIRLMAKESGTYRIDLNDGNDLTAVSWPAGQLMSWKMSLDDHPQAMTGRWHLYFYVPKGTERIGIYSAAGGGTLVDPNGKQALDLKTDGGEFLSVVVPENMDASLWKFHHVGGKVCLLNVPPFLARSADELVLPKDLD